MASKLLRIIAGAGITAALLTGCAPGEPETVPAPSVTLAPGSSGGGNGAPVDSTGQAVGDYEPLVIPAGIVAGVGIDIPDAQLSQTDAEYGLGDLVIANLVQPDANANPYVMLVVDEIGYPLSGAERAEAFQFAGAVDDGERIVQKVTLRLRHIGGHGEMDTWNLARSVMPVNEQLQTMTVIDGPESCGTVKSPLLGHGAETGDTIRVCFYAFGAVNDPASPVSNILVTGRLNLSTVSLYIQSANTFDATGSGDHEDHGHEDLPYKIDPVTGLPIIDPVTGKPVPSGD